MVGPSVRGRGNAAAAQKRRAEVREWMLDQAEPFELLEVIGRFGCSHGYASRVALDLWRAGELERMPGRAAVYQRKAAA